MDFTKPTIEYADIWPLLVIFGVACIGVVVEAFVARERRFVVQSVLAGLGLAVALGGTIWVAGNLDEHADGLGRGSVDIEGTVVVDGPAVFLWGIILVFALGGVLLFAERRLEGGVSAFAGQAAALPGTEAERQASTRGLEHTEVFPLLMFAVAGMMLFPSANDLLTLFVALEVLSLPLYLLCGLARVYGFAGSMNFADIHEAVRNDLENQTLLLIGMGMLSVGLLFKVGAAPFHSWTPDVYQGAPTPVTAFMAAGTKIAAFGAILRLFYVAFGAERWTWQPMMWVIAILTMIVGAVLAVVQTDMKRMLAYSSVAHTGFLLTGVLGVQQVSELAKGELTSLQAVLFYLTTYGFAMVGAFAVVTLVRDSGGEASAFSRWAGLGRRSPLVAGLFAFFLLSMAGIPLTAGFVGKWAVFTVALSAGAWPVVVAAILCSIVAVFFYVRVIVLMFFVDGEPGGEVASVTRPSLLTAATITVGVGATLVLGIVPGPVLTLAAHAGEFVR